MKLRHQEPKKMSLKAKNPHLLSHFLYYGVVIVDITLCVPGNSWWRSSFRRRRACCSPTARSPSLWWGCRCWPGVSELTACMLASVARSELFGKHITLLYITYDIVHKLHLIVTRASLIVEKNSNISVVFRRHGHNHIAVVPAEIEPISFVNDYRQRPEDKSFLPWKLGRP